MQVKDAMHGDALWREPTTPLADIARLMKDQDIGCVPIGENDRLIGMVTDRDITVRAVANGGELTGKTARDVMTEDIVYCMANEDIADAVHLMENKKLRRLPVIDDNKRLVGMLSLGDVAHAADQALSGELTKAVSAHH